VGSGNAPALDQVPQAPLYNIPEALSSAASTSSEATTMSDASLRRSMDGRRSFDSVISGQEAAFHSTHATGAFPLFLWNV
jgi:hypothetical protein